MRPSHDTTQHNTVQCAMFNWTWLHTGKLIAFEKYAQLLMLILHRLSTKKKEEKKCVFVYLLRSELVCCENVDCRSLLLSTFCLQPNVSPKLTSSTSIIPCRSAIGKIVFFFVQFCTWELSLHNTSSRHTYTHGCDGS